ncbi:MAG: CopG family transcriptional regulator [Clostridiales bacterium GWF2_38_85]|nr:MAG: CopG family transcriptional regulator [Clostridiales bacterium GWF2_38_85]
MATKKMGRPTDALKEYMLRVRMDQDTLKKLDECCEIEKLTRSELVRKSIEEEYTKIKK